MIPQNTMPCSRRRNASPDLVQSSWLTFIRSQRYAQVICQGVFLTLRFGLFPVMRLLHPVFLICRISFEAPFMVGVFAK